MKKVRWGVLSTAKIGLQRAVRGEISLPYGIENAIHGMRVIDALFRSERSQRWEAV